MGDSGKKSPTKEVVHQFLKGMMGEDQYSEMIAHSLKRSAQGSGYRGPPKQICITTTEPRKVKKFQCVLDTDGFKFETVFFSGKIGPIPPPDGLDVTNVDLDKIPAALNAALEEMDCKLYGRIVDKDTGAPLSDQVVCALCSPRFTFEREGHFVLWTHFWKLHNVSLKKELEILGKCPRCSTPKSEFDSITVHAVNCYTVANTIVDEPDGDKLEKTKQLMLLEEKLQRAVVYNQNASTPTEHALNEMAKFTEKWPHALEMELTGAGVPLDGTRCKVKLHDLRYCLDSAGGDGLELGRKLTACALTSGDERAITKIIVSATACITEYILKHFGENGELTEEKVRQAVEEGLIGRNGVQLTK